MSKLIPPLVSTTPPPIGLGDVDDNEDDEFGDFAAADDTTYGCDSFSIPNTPEDSPRKTPTLKVQPENLPEVIPDEEITKDYQDKRKNVENIENSPEKQTGNDVEVPNLITNGHNYNDIHSESVKHEDEDASIKDDDDSERPPQLFDDDSEEKEEISETPSNFSISFDDNVICDDDEEEDESDNMPIELPNHVIEADDEKVVETCKNIQEFDDFDDEWKQAEGEPKESVIPDEIVDEIDQFEDCEEEKSSNHSETIDDFGDFNAFASIPTESITQSQQTIQNAPLSSDIQSISSDYNMPVNTESDAKQEGADDDFDDFQFTNVPPKEPEIQEKIEEIIDDFDDFADFSSAPIEPQTVEPSQPLSRSASLEQDGDDDDFGDFDDYTTSTSTSNAIPLLNPEKVYEETQVIFKVMFEPVTLNELDYEYSDGTIKNTIFGQIKDVTDTHALRYQWGKSTVQQGLLKALNIDTRNILYAHGMPMPKFAANLGMTPLEPVKSDILTPTQAPITPTIPSSDRSSSQATTSSVSQASQQNGDIPAAQFDWSASGLANPLDSVSKEETKPTPRTSRTSDDIKFEDTSTLQKPPTYDSESVNSLQFPEMTDVDETKLESLGSADDFSDFTSFQSTYPHQTHQTDPPPTTWSTSNMIPLRETYIDDVKTDWVENGAKSNNHSRKSSYESVGKVEVKEEPDWLQPTILTPVLPHKEIKTTAPTVDVVSTEPEDDFDDFQDFQTSAPPAKVEHKTPPVQNSEVITAYRGSLLNPTVLQPTLLEPVKMASSMEPRTILWPDPGITDEELARFDMYAKKDGNYSPAASSVSLVLNSEPVTSLSSPNDPSISSASVSKAPETKMSGPAGALMVEKHVVVPANKVILHNEVLLPPNNQVVISKDLVLPILESSPRKYTPLQKTIPAPAQDDDDWSDFISTQPTTTGPPSRVSGISASNTSPSKHSLSSTSTSELSLSIPQLRSMQNMQPPCKPPIPVITPRGLVQTKIPSMAPSTPGKSLPQTALHVQPPGDGYQPAIISTQFAAQLNLTSPINVVNQTPFSDFLHNGHYQTTSIPTNGLQQQSPQRKQLNGLHDDDEWSDFMSSQPVNTGNHSLYTPTTQQMQPVQSGNPTPPMINYNQPNLFGAATNSQRADWNRNGFQSDLPNIITNPVHFQSYPTMNTPTNVLNKKSAATNGILHSKNKKPQNLNVARLPDLDFVAPKTKVFHNNKK
ncbi:mucin-2 isoform X3 [Atheta coriaria]|uniref:mucin-2 isoform X3 n=1 Tax=Dalotia coriaria TaxID=877792 RepID=UPI0031F444DF